MATTQQTVRTYPRQNLHNTRGGVEKIKNDLSTPTHDTNDTARSGVSEMRQGMHDAVEAGKGTIQGAKDMVREGYEGTKEAACNATNSLRNVVSDHPIAAVGIAAGAGVLSGGLLIWLWRLRS